jgi:ribonuclease HI
MYELLFDGAYQSSRKVHDAGMMSLGWLILKNERQVAHGFGVAARGVDASSNMAEYLALIDGLQALLDLRVRDAPVKVYGDSRVVISQMRGGVQVNAARLRALHHQAAQLAQRLNIVAWEWVPRTQNQQADQLTRQALRRFHANPKSVKAAWIAILQDHLQRRGRTYHLDGMLVFQK